MNAKEAGAASGGESDVATENGRFSVLPMCQSLTAECARRFKKALLISGGDKVLEDIESGRATFEIPDEDVAEYLKDPKAYKAKHAR